MNENLKELNKALEVETKAFKALNDAITEIISMEQSSFPNQPMMVPTLCVAAICQYLNTYIGTFPEPMKSSILSMAYQTIGFAALDETEDLATMEVAGHA
jgi:hypothetical protein